jgi:hypothetical protein
MQWVTTVEGCEGKSMPLYDGWRTAYAASGANYRVMVSCSLQGSVRHACVYIRTVNCLPLPLPLMSLHVQSTQNIFYSTVASILILCLSIAAALQSLN